MNLPDDHSPSISSLEIRSILLLEDDSDLAEVVQKLLENNGYLVTTAHDGMQGLHEVIELDFDVILCDLMMPKMPGDMFYLAVQRVKPELCSRFVFITGVTDDPKIEKFLDEANGLVLRKPISTDELIKSVGYVIQHNARDAAFI